jgi:uncharacterized membrane protein (DUF4010 family)
MVSVLAAGEIVESILKILFLTILVLPVLRPAASYYPWVVPITLKLVFTFSLIMKNFKRK